MYTGHGVCESKKTSSRHRSSPPTEENGTCQQAPSLSEASLRSLAGQYLYFIAPSYLPPTSFFPGVLPLMSFDYKVGIYCFQFTFPRVDHSCCKPRSGESYVEKAGHIGVWGSWRQVFRCGFDQWEMSNTESLPLFSHQSIGWRCVYQTCNLQ